MIHLGAYMPAGAVVLGLMAPAFARDGVAGQTVIDLETRPGVTTRYLTLAPASRLEPPQVADGLVLTATVTRPAGRQSGPGGTLNVFDMSLARIRVPTSIVHHRSDGCRVTPAVDATALQAKLTGAPRTQVMLFDGGGPARSDACEALSEHGFLGIEPQVVDAIAGWILKGNS